MKNRKKEYLSKIENTCKTINALTLIFSFVGIISTGILALITPVYIPLIISSSVFGVSFIDGVIGDITKFKVKDGSLYSKSDEKTNHHSQEYVATPPLLYSLFAILSVFMRDEHKKSSDINPQENTFSHLEKTTEQNDLKLKIEKQEQLDTNKIENSELEK